MYPSKLETEKIKSSINLVSKDSTTNNLVLNNEALNLIRDLDGKIAVCVCIGQYRSGKSFLLSNLFKYLTNSPYNAFQVGHEENSCTKGCWINKEIPILKAAKKSDQLHLIFIDTEGIESNDSGEQWDTKLFLFSLLISSLFIYNTKNNLSANDFKKLAVMSHLSNRLSLKSSSSRVENEKKLRIEGPDFLCIIRDFSLKEQYTAQESMNRFLQMEPAEKNEQLTKAYLKSTNILNETEQRNEIRKNMINSFKSFNCVRLPEPVSDQTVKGLDREEALQQLDSIKYDDLRDKFRIKFDQMCEELKENLKPKCINETNLNGFKLAEFMKIIVNLINNDETICLHDSLIGAIKREANHSFDSCKLLYENKMKEYAQKLPVKPSELEEKDGQIVKECLIKLHKIIGFNTIILEEFKNKFYEFRNLKYVEFYNENSLKQAALNKQSVITLWQNDFKSKIESLTSLIDFDRFFSDFKTKFEQSDSNLKLTDSFWSEVESFIKIDKIKLGLLEIEKKKFEEEKRRAEEEKRRIEEENKQLKLNLQNQNRADSFYKQQRIVKNRGNDDDDDDDEQYNVVGTFNSNGSANGREVMRGFILFNR